MSVADGAPVPAIAALQEEVAALRRQLDALRAPPQLNKDGAGHSRRDLLRRAAAAAAGTVAGGAVLMVAGADPAAAAPLSGTGNPGVEGIADPPSGIGVRGTSTDPNQGVGV